MRALLWLIASLLVCLPVEQVFATSIKAKKIARHGVWAVYDYDLGDRTVCFAVARPKKVSPGNAADRAPVRAYISTWPDIEPGNPSHDRELSFRVGLKVKSANVKIDGKPYTLFGDEISAFVLEAAQEKKMIAAMRKGKDLAVRAVNEDGTVTTDVYSLKGVTKALKALSKDCGLKTPSPKSARTSMCYDTWAKIRAPEMTEAKELMERGVAYAKANYSTTQIAQIGKYFSLKETLKFRCAGYNPPPGSNPKRAGPTPPPRINPKRP